MTKIVTVCGMGLGSSLIIEINVKDVLKKLGLDLNDFQIEHKNLNSYSAQDNYDVVICGSDLEHSIDAGNSKKVVLLNLMDQDELENKLKEALL